MKTKILGLLAVGLLAGPMAANSAVVYEFTGTGQFEPFTFVYESEGFITATTFVNAAALSSCTTVQGSSCAGLAFLAYAGPIDSLGFQRSEPGIVITNDFFFSEGAFGAFGTYTDSNSFAVLTVREGTSTEVPEPGTLALLGLGLAGLGLSRRRKAN